MTSKSDLRLPPIEVIAPLWDKHQQTCLCCIPRCLVTSNQNLFGMKRGPGETIYLMLCKMFTLLDRKIINSNFAINCKTTNHAYLFKTPFSQTLAEPGLPRCPAQRPAHLKVVRSATVKSRSNTQLIESSKQRTVNCEQTTFYRFLLKYAALV